MHKLKKLFVDSITLMNLQNAGWPSMETKFVPQLKLLLLPVQRPAVLKLLRKLDPSQFLWLAEGEQLRKCHSDLNGKLQHLLKKHNLF